jgi:Uma2 family endonuclease
MKIEKPPSTVPDIDLLLREGAIKLEFTAGIPTWEAFPGVRHQRVIDRIRTSIQSTPANDSCACAHYSDVSIQFSDGSFKRPDIAIFCEEPPDQDEALTIIPLAVVEIISPNYEYKDLELNPPFYLSQGVLDVVIVDPRSGIVRHHRATALATHQAPVTLDLQCGCRCTIPA